ncbi:uncharacterized protein A1O9_00402 [Exophiala aquamarina CBS 119918]|uniref:Mitochondrial inner membrane protease ATP23 n=1 Tax=Exophiala aquamarina CBS 119918 TaxID=1182545 RepID=A0A072Q3F1_9EURO|nr:uncharacterized protein A1O9_00402 [Exophiala aquamarina CBS 119918]KEF62430.1 hypothetical protein A1O9_00402 [Exophiala aquamarina CBS 119918]
MAQPSPNSSTNTNPSSTTPAAEHGWNGSNFLPSDSWLNRTKNFYRMATSQMSAEGAEKYWWDADQRNSTFDCARCEKNRDELLKTSPIIVFMRQNIKSLGGDIGPHNIRCRTCPEKAEGGFDHEYGIRICANYVETKKKLEDVMAHEMVHAYDHLRFKTNLDRDTDLRHSACSEIRASNLSGECRWANEFFKNGFMKFTNHHQDCVRRRAVLSVMARPNCKDDVEAVKVVNEVWDSCFTDTRPFDEIYR